MKRHKWLPQDKGFKCRDCGAKMTHYNPGKKHGACRQSVESMMQHWKPTTWKSFKAALKVEQ